MLEIPYKFSKNQLYEIDSYIDKHFIFHWLIEKMLFNETTLDIAWALTMSVLKIIKSQRKRYNLNNKKQNNIQFYKNHLKQTLAEREEKFFIKSSIDLVNNKRSS